MKLWFERERLRAFGSVLCLPSTATDDAVTQFAGQHGDRCVKTLLELFNKLSRKSESRVEGGTWPYQELDELLPVDRSQSCESPSHGLRQSKEASSGELKYQEVTHPLATGDAIAERNLLETDASRLIQELWDLLPEGTSQKAERDWVHSMLDTTDRIDEWDSTEKPLGR